MKWKDDPQFFLLYTRHPRIKSTGEVMKFQLKPFLKAFEISAISLILTFYISFKHIEAGTPGPNRESAPVQAGSEVLQDRTAPPLDPETNPVPGPPEAAISSITPVELKAKLTFLASDLLEGRETGERGLKLAAEYIASHYHELNLNPPGSDESYFQKFEIIKTSLTENIAMKQTYENDGATVAQEFTWVTDFFLLPWGIKANIEITTPVVFAGYGITAKEYGYDDLKGIKLKGKTVLILTHEPQERDTSSIFNGAKPTKYANFRWKIGELRKRGAAAVLIAIDPLGDHEPFSQYYKYFERWVESKAVSLTSSVQSAMPVFFVNTNVANAILEGTDYNLKDLQKRIDSSLKPRSFHIKNKNITFKIEVLSEPGVTQNVVAWLEGSDPVLKEEILVYSSHYDHLGSNSKGEIYNGADDDGSGTVAVMEIAEAFIESPVPPKRSILFINFAGEEKGLLGSSYYTSNPIFPLERIVADLNLDMIGRNDSSSVYIIGSNMLSRDLHQFSEDAANELGIIKLDYKYNSKDDPKRFYYRSDHYNFSKYNIPVIFYFAGLHEDYHRPTDTIDKINFDKLSRVAKLAFVTGWKVANADRRPQLTELKAKK